MSIAILQRCEPLANANGIECLDMALALANLEQEVALFFADAGVLQLAKGQQPEASARKDHIKTYGALTFYDIEEIYVCQRSLLSYQLSESDLVIPVTVLDGPQFVSKLIKFSHVVNT